MAEDKTHHGHYDHSIIAVSELIWGEGFMSPGGRAAVRSIVEGLELAGRTLLDIGCGIGGPDALPPGVSGRISKSD